MDLFDEEMLNEQKNSGNKKTTTIILVVIILVLIITAALAGIIIYLKQTTLAVKVNGVANQEIKNMLEIDENDPSKVYVPIKKFASQLTYKDESGATNRLYEAFDGSYATKSEDETQCYVQCAEEVAMFKLNSNVIYKTLIGENTDYEYFNIDEKVKSINGELYTTIDGIEKAFNVSFSYDVNKKRIEIYTMPYLISYYSANIMNYGYNGLSEDFTNQKTVLDDMLVVEKGEEGNSQKMGVISTQTGEAILEPKYDNIEYLQYTQDFLVTDNGKKGIISPKDKRTKIAIGYDDIKLMDFDKKLYCVEQDKKFGVIDSKGNIIANLDYETIGIDTSKFKQNDIRNGYVLANNLIPVQKDKLWGFIDTSGNKIAECKYDSLGYIAANNNAGYSLLLVPDYNVIVVEKDQKYNLMDATGKEVYDFFPFDSVYMSIGDGETTYKMTWNSQVLDVFTQLDGLGYGKEEKQ